MTTAVTSASDRPTREAQIHLLAASVPPDGAVKLRFPVQMYDETTKQYTSIRDAWWTVSIPKSELTEEGVTEILDTVDVVMRSIGTHGADHVRRALAGDLP